MTELEYNLEQSRLRENYEAAKKELIKKYAISNKNCEIGDVISSEHETIIIDKIGISAGFLNSYPECVYYGVILTKKGEPNKRGNRGSVYQSHIKKNES